MYLKMLEVAGEITWLFSHLHDFGGLCPIVKGGDPIKDIPNHIYI